MSKRATVRDKFEAWWRRDHPHHSEVDADFELRRHPSDDTYIDWLVLALYEAFEAGHRHGRR